MTLDAATVTRVHSTSLDRVRLIVFGRVVPASFFAWLGYRQLDHLISDVRRLPPSPGAYQLLAGPVPASLYLLFCAIPVAIYVGRPAPRARDGRLLPRAAGLTGTVMLLVVGALPQVQPLFTPSPWLAALSTALTLVAFSMAVCGLLFLRRSLSIIPEARRLVTGGPYRLVRHPLYGAEIIASVAYVLAAPTPYALGVLVPFVATQMLRSRFEERLLGDVYPEYRTYAARTARLLPFVW